MTGHTHADRREIVAAELHRLDSWSARIAAVRLLAERQGVRMRVASRYHIRIYGREGTSGKSADAALAGWALAVMREFPQRAAA